MPTVRRRLLVSGRVQGVWFRQSCAGEATALGLSGWVRNLPDGRVEAVFEGAEDAVSRMARWCHSGPRLAEVTRVEVFEEEPAGEPGFRVR